MTETASAPWRLTDFAAMTFDCYGTLIDWERGLLAALAPWAARGGDALVDGPVGGPVGGPVDSEALLAAFSEHETRLQQADPAALYSAILARVFDAIAAQFGVPAAPDEAARFAASIAAWPPFPDSSAALAYLKTHFKLVAVSNVDRRSFAPSSAALGDPFEAVITAEEVKSYKPARAHFDRALAWLGELGIPKAKVLHVAQSLYHDIAPAKALGLATVWVDRRGDQSGGATPPADAQPDLRVTSLAALAERHRAELAEI